MQEAPVSRSPSFGPASTTWSLLGAARDDLEQWAERLNELGVRHSGVKNLDYPANAMLTFRDPDNIQLEFFWRANAPRSA
jgi:hypothetical protein